MMTQAGSVERGECALVEIAVVRERTDAHVGQQLPLGEATLERMCSRVGARSRLAVVNGA